MTGSRLAGIGITKTFGGLTAVDDMSVTAEPGQVTALIGPNGAGKTTLFQCLTGEERPDAGKVLLDERDEVIHHFAIVLPDRRLHRRAGGP